MLRPSGARPSAESRGLTVTWLGTASFLVESRTTRLAIDPYLTRASFGTLLTRALAPDPVELERHLPSRLDAVLCGHSHFDHLLDAPWIAQRFSARLYGSSTTLAFGRAMNVPSPLLVDVPEQGASFTIGDLEVSFVPSKHAKLFCGHVPFPGKVDQAPVRPRFWDFRMGGAFGIFVRGAGVNLYHNGSADLVDAALSHERADAVLLGIAGWKKTPEYLGRILATLEPRVVIPAHHDLFFTPLDAGAWLLPGVDFPRFLAGVEHVVPRATIVAPNYREPVWIAPEGRSAQIVQPA